MLTKLFRILGAIAVLATLSLACAATGDAGASREAPDFTLTSVTGNEYQLSAYRGKPVLLNFFTTWCGPCRAEMPGMQEMYARYKSKGLVLLAVDLGDSSTDVASYRKELGLHFPLLLDPNSEIGDLYGVNSYPRTFFIDTKGVIQKTVVGSMSEGDIEAEIQNLLSLAEAAQKADLQAGGGSGIEGCVNIASARARTGPGKKFPGELELKISECYPFDARSADSAWLRLENAVAVNGARLWVFAQYINLKADVNSLPVAE